MKHLQNRRRRWLASLAALALVAAVAAVTLETGIGQLGTDNEATHATSANPIYCDADPESGTTAEGALLEECELLLELRDALAGTGMLNWSAETPIGQ